MEAAAAGQKLSDGQKNNAASLPRLRQVAAWCGASGDTRGDTGVRSGSFV